MRLGLIFAGVGLLVLAALPSALILAALQSTEAAEALSGGLILLRIMLVLTGAWLLMLTRVPATASHDTPTVIEPAPPMAGFLLLGIVAVALALRFYALDLDIWFDEMVTEDIYMDLPPMQVLTTFHDANNHVLFTFFARLAIEIFGDNVWALRLPAVIFGAASAVAIYAFARRVMSWQEALLAALFLAVSFHHIWFSQNARGYTMLVFFALVSSTLLIDAVRTGSRGRWLGFAAAGALGAWTHLTVGFLFLGHFAWFLGRAFSRDGRSKGLFVEGMAFGFIPLGLFVLLLYAIVLPTIFGGALLASGSTDGTSPWANPLWAIAEFITSLQTGFSGPGVLIAGGILALIGTASFLRTNAATVVFLAVPCGLALLLMTSIGYTLFPRFFFFAMGFGIVLVIRGAAVIGQLADQWLGGRSRAWLLYAPALAIIAASLVSLPRVYLPKQSYLATLDYLDENLRAGDTVAVLGTAAFPFVEYYGRDWTPVVTADDIAGLLDRGDGRVWTIHMWSVHVEGAEPEIAKLIDERFTEQNIFYGSLGGGEIIVSLSNDTAGAGS